MHTRISSSSKLGQLAEMHRKISNDDGIERMAGAKAVVIFSWSTCCMCHAVKRLFCGMGVNPTVHDLDEHPNGKQLYRELMMMMRRRCHRHRHRQSTASQAAGGSAAVPPVVFIGGNLVGGIESVLASHINGTLVPLLKQAGALWL